MVFTQVTPPRAGLLPWILPGGTGSWCGAPGRGRHADLRRTPRAAALGRRSPCLTSLPRYQRRRTVRPGVSPALQLPYAAEDGPVSTRPAVVGVGGEEHSDPPYRGTARQSTRRAAQRGMGRRLLATYPRWTQKRARCSACRPGRPRRRRSGCARRPGIPRTRSTSCRSRS